MQLLRLFLRQGRATGGRFLNKRAPKAVPSNCLPVLFLEISHGVEGRDEAISFCVALLSAAKPRSPGSAAI